MKNKIIVYYPYKLREQTSGSAVRPVKMIEAFKELGNEKEIEIIEIHGESKERSKKLDELYNKVNPKEILLCYMENSTTPMWLTDSDHIPRRPFLDLRFLNYLKKNKIPLGLFYRDIYWKFEHLYSVNKWIKPFMIALFKIELFLFKKYANTIFLPSVFMNKYVQADEAKIKDLPPGGVNLLTRTKIAHDTVNAIYVGGINPRYGIYETLAAFKELNLHNNRINLTLVCRKEEFAKFHDLMSPFIEEEWLNLHHAYGDALKPLYKNVDFGIVPIKKDTYNDFAIAVKMFEYISYGLPVLATNCDAQKAIVDRSHIGIVVEDTKEGILEGLINLTDEHLRQELKKRVANALLNEHLWVHRALSVYEKLLNKEGEPK